MSSITIRNADVVIVGASVAGIATAATLHKCAPSLKIVILEQYPSSSGNLDNVTQLSDKIKSSDITSNNSHLQIQDVIDGHGIVHQHALMLQHESNYASENIHRRTCELARVGQKLYRSLLSDNKTISKLQENTHTTTNEAYVALLSSIKMHIIDSFPSRVSKSSSDPPVQIVYSTRVISIQDAPPNQTKKDIVLEALHSQRSPNSETNLLERIHWRCGLTIVATGSETLRAKDNCAVQTEKWLELNRIDRQLWPSLRQKPTDILTVPSLGIPIMRPIFLSETVPTKKWTEMLDMLWHIAHNQTDQSKQYILIHLLYRSKQSSLVPNVHDSVPTQTSKEEDTVEMAPQIQHSKNDIIGCVIESSTNRFETSIIQLLPKTHQILIEFGHFTYLEHPCGIMQRGTLHTRHLQATSQYNDIRTDVRTKWETISSLADVLQRTGLTALPFSEKDSVSNDDATANHTLETKKRFNDVCKSLQDIGVKRTNHFVSFTRSGVPFIGPRPDLVGSSHIARLFYILGTSTHGPAVSFGSAAIATVLALIGLDSCKPNQQNPPTQRNNSAMEQTHVKQERHRSNSNSCTSSSHTQKNVDDTSVTIDKILDSTEHQTHSESNSSLNDENHETNEQNNVDDTLVTMDTKLDSTEDKIQSESNSSSNDEKPQLYDNSLVSSVSDTILHETTQSRTIESALVSAAQALSPPPSHPSTSTSPHQSFFSDSDDESSPSHRRSASMEERELKRRRLRFNAAKELMETETRYLFHLRNLVDMFACPLDPVDTSSLNPLTSPRCCATPESLGLSISNKSRSNGPVGAARRASISNPGVHQKKLSKYFQSKEELISTTRGTMTQQKSLRHFASQDTGSMLPKNNDSLEQADNLSKLPSDQQSIDIASREQSTEVNVSVDSCTGSIDENDEDAKSMHSTEISPAREGISSTKSASYRPSVIADTQSLRASGESKESINSHSKISWAVRKIKSHNILTPTEHQEMFSNVAQLPQLHSLLLSRIVPLLDDWNDDTTAIGKALLECLPFLRMYSQYCRGYDRAQALCDRLMASKKNFKRYVEAAEATSTLQNQSLRSLMIMPVQRVMRYALLFGELLKHTPNDHFDRDNIAEALRTVKEVNEAINSSVGRADRQLKLQDAASRINGCPPLVEPHREYVMEDLFLKGPSSKQKGTPLHVFLFSDILIYCSYTGFGKPNLSKVRVGTTKVKFRRMLYLSDSCLTKKNETSQSTCNNKNDSTSSPLLLTIYGSGKPLELQARSEQQKQLWFENIQTCIDKIRAQKDSRRQSLSYTAKDKPRTLLHHDTSQSIEEVTQTPTNAVSGNEFVSLSHSQSDEADESVDGSTTNELNMPNKCVSTAEKPSQSETHSTVVSSVKQSSQTEDMGGNNCKTSDEESDQRKTNLVGTVDKTNFKESGHGTTQMNDIIPNDVESDQRKTNLVGNNCKTYDEEANRDNDTTISSGSQTHDKSKTDMANKTSDMASELAVPMEQQQETEEVSTAINQDDTISSPTAGILGLHVQNARARLNDLCGIKSSIHHIHLSRIYTDTQNAYRWMPEAPLLRRAYMRTYLAHANDQDEHANSWLPFKLSGAAFFGVCAAAVLVPTSWYWWSHSTSK